MGKNKNRNKRNKKKNVPSVETKKALDKEVNTFSDCNPIPTVKEEFSISAKCTVENQKICKTQSVSNFNQKSLSNLHIAANFKGASSGTNIIHKDSEVQNHHAEKSQPEVQRNFTGKAYPLMKINYAKTYTCTENNTKTQNFILNSKFSAIGSDEDFDVEATTSEKKKSLGSVSSMKGARPKSNTKQIRVLSLNNVSQSAIDMQNVKQCIQGSVRRSENHWEHFERLYRTWKIERQNTIKKLQKLVEEVHKDQMLFNQSNVALKKWNIGSREVKSHNSSPAVDFLASLTAFVTDAANSVTSVIQACNVDSYTTMFKEIMENDAQVTRPLYEARSQSLVEYKNVEEIIRKCHSDTFGNTIGNISSTLKIEDLWLDIKNAKGDNSVGQIIDSVDLFLKRNANVEKMGEVYDSIQGYLNGNPAALEACKYAGRALYDVYDTWGRDPKQRSSIANNMSIVSNRLLLQEEKKELNHLQSIANNDEKIQAKLESDIYTAINSLECEMKEISNIFQEKSFIYNSGSWYF